MEFDRKIFIACIVINIHYNIGTVKKIIVRSILYDKSSLKPKNAAKNMEIMFHLMNILKP